MKAILWTAAAVLIAGLAWFGRSAWGGWFLVDESPGMDIYHLSTLYERWAHHIAGGSWPSWMPEFAGGYPAPASWMYGLQYPGLALFVVLPADAAWTWTAILHMVLAGVGMHRLVKAETDDDVAGVTAGLLFGLSELMVGRVLFGHLNVTMPLAWTPWVFLHLRGVADGRRFAAAWLVVCASLGLLAGHVQVWFYVVPAAVAYAAVAWRATPDRRRCATSLGIAALLVALVTAPQWLTTAELFSVSRRAGDSLDVTDFCAPLHVLVAKLFPGVLGHRPDTYWAPDPADHELGAIGGLLLVALAVPVLLRPGRKGWTWIGIGVLGLLLAPGVLNPVSDALNAVPPFRFGRTPARALVLVTLAGAVLAGHGVARWREVPPAGLVRAVTQAGILVAVVAAAGVGLLAALLGDAGFGTHGAVVWRAVVTSVVLAGGALAAVLVSRTQPRAWLGIPVLAGLAFILGGAPPATTVRSDFYFTDWRAMLPEDIAEHRVHLANARFPNVERQGLRTLREICYVDTRWYADFTAEPGPARAAWLDVGAQLAGIPRERLMSGSVGPADVAGQPMRSFGAGQVFTGARAEADDARVLAALDGGARTLFLADGPDDEKSRPVDAARVTRKDGDAPTETRFDVETPTAGWLVVAEKHYPGWTATVAGEAAEIHRANVTFRAVRVPAGRSEVVFRYGPWTTRVGLLLLALGAAGTGLVFWREARRRAPLEE